jgi:hypothetical protein
MGTFDLINIAKERKMRNSNDKVTSLMLTPVSFGGVDDDLADETDDFEWDNGFRHEGFKMVMAGTGTVASGAVVTQFDSPLLGPADLAGGAIVAVGVAEIAIGTVVYGAGLVGGAIDQLTGP